MTLQRDNPRMLAPPPPAVSLTRAMLWNRWIVLLCVVIFAGIAAAAALLRSPDYTATAKLTIGGIDISAPGALSGYATASEALAAGYSRTVNARAVAKQVSAETGIPVDDVQGHVTGTPIKESPVFRIEATAPNSHQAIELANHSSRALIRYATKLSQTSPDTTRLFARYRAATAQRKQARQRLKTAMADVEADETLASEEEVGSARANLEVASLRVTALQQAYTLSVQGQVSTQLIQVISPATSASSDRRSTFAIYTIIGFVIGLLVGAALAFVRESRFTSIPND
jgi:uncharacterized protein involved in exopolysaccharide biosynthesis